MEHVILVDEEDNQIGLMEKIEAHKKGLLHRAFSVFLFNDKHEILMQRRALSKYHSGGLWTNTCCSHPREHESIEEAGKRRLIEEMGFSCDVERVFSFIYKAKLDNELSEHEFDYVLMGKYNKRPKPNPIEVMDWKYMDMKEIEFDILENPGNYTVWFLAIFERVKNHFYKTSL
ncbi:isopentenyl-diphosphate Delta-isomerase [Crocinitomix sp.]|nr:isopentenyl-diphosphate Delta-isomerase [Crocinitomix sp.]